LRAAFTAVGALAVLAAAGSLAACGDPFGGTDPLLRTDSVALASVTGPSQLPTAIDIVSNNALALPELPTEAGDWDFQVRTSAGALVLHPNPGTAPYRGAGLLKTTADFANPGSASRDNNAYTRTDVAIQPGEVYYLQSRQRNNVCGTVPTYGVLKVLSLRPDSGVAHLVVTSNHNCDDERLTP
jgi:hypothetical protein